MNKQKNLLIGLRVYNNELSQVKKQHAGTNNNTNDTTITQNYKYVFDKPVVLKGKYLKLYENMINEYKMNEHVINLYDAGFYEYQYKLKQHLSNCGLNKVMSINNCNMINFIINNIIFGDKQRQRFMQLLNTYIDKNDILKLIKQTDAQSYYLIKEVDYNDKNIFTHLICVLYKVLFDKGIHDMINNYTLINLSINIRKSRDIPEYHTQVISDDPNIISGNLCSSSIAATYDIMLNIFNKYIDEQEHLTHIGYKDDKNIYAFNKMHFIKLDIDIKGNNCIIVPDYYNNTKRISNISVNNFIVADTPYMLNTLDLVQFIFVYPDSNILDTITCGIDDKQVIYKLESALIYVNCISNNNTKISYIYNCLICSNEYYIHEPFFDEYFKIDWRNTNPNNFKQICAPNNISKIVQIIVSPAIYYKL